MITIKNESLTAQIDEKGAQLSRLATGNAEYIYDDLAVWNKHAPVLFPFAGRLKDQKFTYRGREYGPVRIHGFAPYADYEVTDRTATSVRMRLIVTSEIAAIWPFDFAFSVRFELRENTLSVTYEVENHGENTMYYGLGSHPGFNVPLTGGLRFEDYYVEFPEAKALLENNMSENCLMLGTQSPCPVAQGNRIALRHDLFDHDAVILSGMGKTAVLATEKDRRKVIVTFPDTAYCAIWHKVKMQVPFLCIEPWTSLPGDEGRITALETKPDYNSLQPGGYREHHLNITIIE